MTHLDASFREPSLETSAPPAKADSHRNNFNFLRLVFAWLVLVSHSWELIDGDGHREPLFRIFRTLTLGEVAVDGFFLLSGFLIVQSWQRNPSLVPYFRKRILRIYPGFIAASLVCAFIVGPLGANASAYFHQLVFWRLLKGMIELAIPTIPPIFAGHPYPGVNNPMWTITYEFRCYAAVAFLGICGLVERRRFWLGMSVIVILLSLVPGEVGRISFPGLRLLVLNLSTMIHFFSFFCAGACFYLFRRLIRYRLSWAWCAAAAVFACMVTMTSAQLALPILGGYALFALGFAQIPLLKDFGRRPDISYGVYLYGWPTQQLLLWYIPSLSAWELLLLTCPIAAGVAFLSWHFVEHPFMRMKNQPLVVSAGVQ